METHTFTAAWEESGPTSKDVVALTYIPMFGKVKAIKLLEDSENVVNKADKEKLEALNKALPDSNLPTRARMPPG